ncbi:MAG: glycosyltransferase [archaeon YNP-WB-062]|jgi:glycosyltransferase involved in cell wall biosynthesis|nr:glycosyltransferase [Candidatus Culexarchaeum yellowstonense]
MDRELSIALISGAVGKTPEDVPYSFVFDEAYRLARRKVKVHVVRSKIEGECTSYGINFHGIEKKYDAQALNFLTRNVACYPPISLMRNPKRLYWENLYALNVSKVVEKYDVNLIHAHFAYPEGLVGLLAKKKTGKPLIITCHGYDINVVPEIGYGIRLSKKYDALVRKALKNADAVICVSNGLRKEILKLKVDAEKVFVVFNAVDLEVFRPPQRHELNDIKEEVKRLFEVDEDDFLILNARHLRPVYGIEYLIYAASIVVNHVKNARFIIAGEGELREKLKAMIQSMGLQKHVRLVGKIPRTLMPKLMRASSIYVNTSLADGMSPSMLEACASGIPIVSFDVGGAGDVIDDGINGLLVPLKDSKMLASKIIYLLQNTDILKKMGAMARKKAEMKFNVENRINTILSIYQKLL